MNIENFINFYTNNTIKARGKEILKNDGVELIEINEYEGVAIFDVTGNETYRVEISFDNHDELDVQCTCPYFENYDELCKHGVAALYFFKNQLNNTKNTKKISLRNSSDFIEYKNVEDVNSTYNVFKLPNQYYYILNFEEFKEEEIQISLSVKNSYWDERKNTVTFVKEKNILKSKCTCSTNNAGNCEHEAFLIEFFNKSSDFKLHELFDYQILETKLKPKYDDLGVSFEYFLKNFTISIGKNNKITWIAKDGRKILGKSDIKKMSKNISAMPTLESIINEKFHHSGAFQKKDIGLILHGKDFLCFTPVMANVNKLGTDLMSSFEKLEEGNSILDFKPVEGIEKLISLCASLEMHLDRTSEESDFLDSLYQQIIPLLKNIKHVYKWHLDSSGYKYYHSYKYTNFVKRDLVPVKIAEEKVCFKLSYFEDEFLVGVRPVIYLKSGVELDVKNIESRYYMFVHHSDSLYFFNSTYDYESFERFEKEGVVSTSKENKNEFLKNYLFPLTDNYPIDFADYQDFQEIKLVPQEKNVYLSDVEGFMVFTPEVVYQNDIRLNPISYQNHYQMDDASKITVFIKDQNFDNEFYEKLVEIQPLWKNQTNAQFFYLPIDLVMDRMWFFRAFEKFKENNINVHGLSKLKYFKYSPHKAVIHSHIKSGQDWFDVEIDIKFGDESVKLSDIKKAIKNKSNFVLLSDGTYGMLPEDWLAKFERYFRAGEVSKNNIKVSKLKFHLIDELFADLDQSEIIEEITEKKQKLLSFNEIKETIVPKQITATLRDYQKEGLNWLNFLNEFKWGGILADDMGLGKTLQVIAFLKQIEKESHKVNLIVVPTTLIFNWETEFQKFAPSTKVFYYYGPQRERNIDVLKKQNIVITSYGTLVNDIDLFQKIKFNYVILDESQAIKNPNSLRYKSVCLLKAENRIVCTGTPIENNTFDLYAQFSFLNPGFFGSQNAFKENFSIPIDKEKSEEVAMELQKMINPFIIRRTKEQVVKELPPKTESILYCTMGEEQMKIYTAYRNKYRDYILKKMDDNGLEKSKLFVLEGLLKLRQICDSPEMLSDSEYYGNESIKIKELLNHIENKTGKHKILIFSQFVSMLKLIKNALDTSKIKHEYLDGSCNTKQRQESVENFQNNNDVRVFLISLKAGGFGLNLTAADYVYIVDPWWNPAVENQAIDRCYRIGQDKNVFAYRMICKDTIEEKIMTYQNSKKQLAENIIQTDESILKSINREDILNLFS